MTTHHRTGASIAVSATRLAEPRLCGLARNLRAQPPRPDGPPESATKPAKVPALVGETAGSVRTRPAGFALVVTLSLMVLLALLAVGLLSLSAVTLRRSAQELARAEARANARLALWLALGELQRQAGPDTRVTAAADVLDEKNPPLTGVWRSWEGTNHQTGRQFTGRPITPDYKAKRQGASGNGRFLGWLVSQAGHEPKLDQAATLVRRAPFAGSVPLVAQGSLAANDARAVHLTPLPLAGRGTFAWWVSGENQKARIPSPSRPPDDSAGRWAVLAKSHATADPRPFQLEALLDDPAPAAKAATRATADLIAKGGATPRPRERFHDLTATSVGLLTNTATGGWRKDLSLLTESWGRQPKSGLPLFRLSPTQETQAAIPTAGAPYPGGSMLYPWAAYRGDASHIPIYRHGPVASWENLVDYATLYKRIGASASGRITVGTQSVAIDDNGNHFNFIHRVRILPLIARMQWVFSHSAAAVAGAPAGNLEPRLLLTPVITMWNPYNMEITAPAPLDFSIPKPLPPALRYVINGRQNPNYNSVMAALNNQPSLGGGTLRMSIRTAFTLRPGETLVFSPATTTPVADNVSLDLQQGYRAGGGHFFPVKGSAGERLSLAGSASIRADAKFDSLYHDGHLINPEGVGIYLDLSIGGRRHLVYRMIYTPEIANVVYPPLTRLAEGTLSQCVANPLPFLSTIFGARTASRTHFAAKGFIQSSPLVNYTAMGRKDEGERTIARHYGGTAHPVNSPFDYSFVKHAPGGDSLLPNASDASGRGYIITGFSKADGLTRCVIAELPSRPLVSLGELAGWDLRYENPIPPYAFNLIGNSDATPLLPANAVVNSRDAGLAENLQYDDSYCANHLLFDDWFFSSIAPDPDHFGTSGRSQQQTYTEFVTGEAPLAHPSYQPILLDRARAAAGDSRALFSEHVSKTDSWKSIASRLEVEGMFNINSTSVTAWRALLGHARNQRVAYISDTGRSWRADLSGKLDHPVSRFSVAGDARAGTPGSSGAFPEATEFAGYRTLDEDFLDALARETVRQVRLRGPFLSLAEFINRQLSAGDLALAGALQTALNEVTKRRATDPLAPLKALSTPAAAVPARAAEAEYRFPEAAAGYSGYGLPGWTRQVDILRPLAPVLSARDDTFTIRAYGDARDADGRIISRAFCEAVVRRTRDFVDPAEAAEKPSAPTRAVNQRFGRRFEVIDFRWLSPDEV